MDRLKTASELDLWVARGGVEPPTFRFSVGRSYQLSYLAGHGSCYTCGLGTADRHCMLRYINAAHTARRWRS